MLYLSIGKRVSWVGAAGRAYGTIENFDNVRNVKGETIPWITISCKTPLNPNYSVRFPATSDYLSKMKLTSIQKV
jgi:hypothetical protein|tara:strand:- start:145 stop:369 length:225 start_codon:yes stop_codon:yes gene_type:complete